jgi:hypothetical protein
MDDAAPVVVAPRRGITRAECFGFLALVIVLAWPFGIFDRFPFDDEMATLDIIARYSPSELFVTSLGTYDINIPPGSYLIFQLLAHFGLPIWGMRLASLLMSGIAFLFILDLTLATIRCEDKTVRLATMFLFLSFPLLYGVGDALRWYPAFAAFVAGFFWLELRRGRPTMMGGMLLGLAASTSFLAIIPYFAFAAQRYFWRRKFDIRVDGPFHLVLAGFAAPGLMAFAIIVAEITKTGEDPTGFLQISTPISGLVGIVQAGLGFLGGYRLGPVDIVLGIPYLALLVLSLGNWVLRRRGKISPHDVNDSANDLFIIFAVMATLCALYSLASSFSEGRAWLFLAPFMLACFALGYWHRFSRSFLPIFLTSLLLFSAALANGRRSDAPYKRNLVIPHDEVIDFVAENAHGSVLYVSNEPVGAFLLRGAGYCLMTSYLVSACAEQALDHFDTIVIAIDSHFQDVLDVDKVLREIRVHRTLRTKARFGYDRWARLKSLLTSTRLDPWILTVEIY